MVLLGLARYTLDFGIVVRWWMILQKCLDWVHPIICWLLIWFIDDREICFTGWLCWLD
jgi:hypothetical protein